MSEQIEAARGGHGETTNRLQKLEAAGQAVWLDFIDRRFIADGGLKKLVDEDGLTGVTSNPSIFEKAIGHSDAYDDQLKAQVEAHPGTVEGTYEALAIKDIQDACDTLRPVYDRLDGRDGFVSMEVSPYLAMETAATLAAAKRLWTEVDRPNLMIKIPGTDPGVPAIRGALEAGVNINVTLLFSIDAYKAVLEAYIAALESRVARGEPIDRLASVASFFVSRIDGVIDKKIDELGTDEARAIRGKVAIANAKMAYQHYLDVIGSPRWRALAERGARPQRLLWASTGTKDKAYSDVLYVEPLIGPDTVNTMPPATMDAFRDHGEVSDSLASDIEGAARVLATAGSLGLDLTGVTAQLVNDGVRSFADAADALYGAVAEKRGRFLAGRLDTFSADLPADLDARVKAVIERARAEGWSRKLWAHDASMWTGGDEGKWLGWLAAAEGKTVDISALQSFGEDAKAFSDVVLLGMGGSSLGAEVMSEILGSGSPKLHVVDGTDPEQIASVTDAIDLANTLVVVASKSGTTMEPELLRAYFYAICEKAVDEGEAGGHFVAITDPGSSLEVRAKEDRYGHIFLGEPSIGGRYSVLSAFGMVPSAAIGIDVVAFFDTVKIMTGSVGPDAPPAANPGFQLGAIMGAAAVAGRDKLTLVVSPALKSFGAWVEQLIAESTGKQGKGIVPVDLEPLGGPADYGDDRLFVHLHLDGDHDEDSHTRLAALKAAGHPVVTIGLARREDIGQEFVRWEIATAVAGAVLGIDPFDQPDVEDAKVQTRELIRAYEQSGSLGPERSFFEDRDFAFYGPEEPGGSDAVAILRSYLSPAAPPAYAAFLTYLERTAENEALITRMRVALRDTKRVATLSGFGPRYLHSTGQLFKGGPKDGVFLEITRTSPDEVSIPGSRASFAVVQAAQARGDMEVLEARGQRVLRVHLKDARGGLHRLAEAIERAVAA